MNIKHMSQCWKANKILVHPDSHVLNNLLRTTVMVALALYSIGCNKGLSNDKQHMFFNSDMNIRHMITRREPSDSLTRVDPIPTVHQQSVHNTK